MTRVDAASANFQECTIDQIYDLAKTPGVTGNYHFGELLSLVTGESNFEPHAHNRHTGAEGPFQFVKGTWLDLLYKHGAELGVKPELLAHIARTAKGRLVVENQEALKSLLALRNDVALATRMAAKYLDDNRVSLSHMLHREPSKAEIQLSFLLGPTGTARLLKAAEHAPELTAEQILPHAAHANRHLFYEPGGRARTVRQALAYLDQRNHANQLRFAAYVRRELPGLKLNMDA